MYHHVSLYGQRSFKQKKLSLPTSLNPKLIKKNINTKNHGLLKKLTMVYPPQLFRQAHGPHGPHGRFRGTGAVSAPSVCESRSTPPPSDHPALVAFGSGDGMWKSEMEITRCWCEFSIIQSNFDLKNPKIQSSTGKTRLEIDWKSDFDLYPTDKASTNAWRTTPLVQNNSNFDDDLGYDHCRQSTFQGIWSHFRSSH